MTTLFWKCAVSIQARYKLMSLQTLVSVISLAKVDRCDLYCLVLSNILHFVRYHIFSPQYCLFHTSSVGCSPSLPCNINGFQSCSCSPAQTCYSGVFSLVASLGQEDCGGYKLSCRRAQTIRLLAVGLRWLPPSLLLRLSPIKKCLRSRDMKY